MTVPNANVRTNIKTIDEVRRAITDLARTAKNMDYETAERATGKTWIDGKMIYRIVVETGALANNGSTTDTITLDAAMDSVVSISGVMKNAGGTISYLLPWIPVNNLVYIRIGDTNTTTPDIIITTTADYSTFTAVVTVEYTKA